MRRLIPRLSVLLAASLATTACATAPEETAPPQSADAAAQADSAKPFATEIAKQPHTLDGEIRRAQLLRAQGDFKGAIHILSQLMLVAPDDARVVGEYGKVLAQSGRPSDAVNFLKRAVELQPDNWTFYSALGVADDQLGKRREAETDYRHALALKPDEPSILNNYAMSQMMAGNLGHAEDLLHQAEAHGGDHPKIAANLKMIAEMRARRGDSGPQSAAPSAVAVANAAPTGAVEARPMPRSTAEPAPTSHGPRPLQADHPAPSARHKHAKPRVVMAKIPYDPLAGKHYPTATEHEAKTAEHTKPVKTAIEQSKPNQHVASAESKAEPNKAADQAPALRTAADIY